MKVLVVKVGGLGDTLSAAPLVQALGREGVTVTVLGGPAASLLPAARVVTVPRDGLSGVAGLRFVPRLARRVGRQDVALSAFDTCSAAQAVAACVARRRIGFAAGIARGEALLTERLPFDAARPVADLALDLARRLLGRSLVLDRSAPACRWDGRDERTPYGVLHGGAATAVQRWPGFDALAGVLEARTSLSWRCLDGASLDDLGSALAGARVFVGCHSGPLHLAAALGVPSVAVAGPTALAWDPPWRDVPVRVLRAGLPCQPCGRVGAPARSCPHGAPPPCLAAVSGRAVAQAVAEVLADAR